MKPVFCDVKLSDGTIDETKIEDLITRNTVAIIPVHVYGNICNIEKASTPDKIDIDTEENDDNDSDVVKYIQFFSKKLILKQFMNNLITDGLLDDKYTDEINENIYTEKNRLRYNYLNIRKKFS